jgi:hypothetical protein
VRVRGLDPRVRWLSNDRAQLDRFFRQKDAGAKSRVHYAPLACARVHLGSRSNSERLGAATCVASGVKEK